MAKVLLGLHANPTFESLALEGRTFDFENYPGHQPLKFTQGFFSPLDPSGELRPTDENHDDKVDRTLAVAQAMKDAFDALLEEKRRKNARLFQDAPHAQMEEEMAAPPPVRGGGGVWSDGEEEEMERRGPIPPERPLGPGHLAQGRNKHWDYFMGERAKMFKRGPDLNDRKDRNRNREQARHKVERGKALEHKRLGPEEYDISTPRDGSPEPLGPQNYQIEEKYAKRMQARIPPVKRNSVQAFVASNRQRNLARDEQMAGKRASAEQIARKRPGERLPQGRLRKRKTESGARVRQTGNVRFDVGPVATAPR